MLLRNLGIIQNSEDLNLHNAKIMQIILIITDLIMVLRKMIGVFGRPREWGM